MTLALQTRLRAVTEQSARLQAIRDQTQKELSAREKEVEDLTHRLDLLAKVGELFRILMDKLVHDHVKSLESIVTDGLQAIFQDQHLSFEAEVSQKYNKIAIDFFIRQDETSDKVSIRGNPLESFGGGPASIASLTLRILTLLRLKKFPLLCLDETLAAVSDEYVDQTGQFLRKLASETGIPLLLVTHKQAFTEHANVSYSGSEKIGVDGSRSLILHRGKN